MGSTWGNSIRISVFGESHGAGIGVTIDGFPPGVVYDEAFILREMERRAPGRNKQSTARSESDTPRILSGVFDGRTTGTPVCAVIENTNQHSGDYAGLADQPRPGHADYTGMLRYKKCNDPRGGGHFSGRLTAPLVFAGALCKLWLKMQGVLVGSHIQSIAQIQDMPFDDVCVTPAQLEQLRLADYPVQNPRALDAMLAAIEDARLEQDSVGGVIECAAIGVPAGLGSPMMDTVESRLSSILFAVPAVKGVEFGAGFGFAALRGSHANDAFYKDGDVVKTETNNNGGILGGITSGMPLLVRAAIKPTPSISQTQQTLSLSRGTVEQLSIHGRHDPCIVTRAAPVIEAAVAVALADLVREANGYA
ncbi:chorismate synthase [Agathobaculum sp.]|uniref:chorismate synthase n=1 Tax=Agathobaculum sp. TaxID=2048138 RepID=UPI002A8012D9|nr:chorismate synthase [Agathobaculum sp.]MDY3618504.1 chorismate synthase [Agathobaculum sp.]